MSTFQPLSSSASCAARRSMGRLPFVLLRRRGEQRLEAPLARQPVLDQRHVRRIRQAGRRRDELRVRGERRRLPPLQHRRRRFVLRHVGIGRIEVIEAIEQQRRAGRQRHAERIDDEVVVADEEAVVLEDLAVDERDLGADELRHIGAVAPGRPHRHADLRPAGGTEVALADPRLVGLKVQLCIEIGLAREGEGVAAHAAQLVRRIGIGGHAHLEETFEVEDQHRRALVPYCVVIPMFSQCERQSVARRCMLLCM
jgi:hypothetical protein